MITLVTASTEQPVSLSDAKSHVGQADTMDDVYIRGLIGAARAHTEMFTRRAWIDRTVDWNLPAFPAFPILLNEWPLAPLSSITSIKYVDNAGETQTWAASNYIVQTGLSPGVIELAFNVTVPTTRNQPNAVTIRKVMGYGGVDDVPPDARHAMLMLIAHWYENREEVTDLRLVTVPTAAESLMWGLKVGTV